MYAMNLSSIAEWKVQWQVGLEHTFYIKNQEGKEREREKEHRDS